ncbi:GNAT family N-acetyltransferase [Ignatzschineria larvae DSM 13226]|uniref:GNAT family N-acetyltransferase n=1 Tax=Ignatzschineria larvae DSM 13226 TaxID=1111732 RepID=A0ABZ3BZE2_9GAMM|nr:GNAT family N-acetyltransferase [Ignatzschineria larvae]
MTNKEKYTLLCQEEKSIPIYQQYWWLDAVATNSWDVVLIEKSGVIQAALPYVLKKKYGLTIITQPQLTQFLGPWVRHQESKVSTLLSREKELLQELFNLLPNFDLYRQNWSPERTNWLPLYWRDYRQTTRYTYQFNQPLEVDDIWKKLDSNTRRHLRKAEEELEIIRDLPIDNFIELNKKVFAKQNLSLPFSEELIKQINEACLRHNSGTCFYAVDKNQKIHAALYLIWDELSTHCIMSGSDPEIRNSSAVSLCQWNGIKFAAEIGKSFDFCGSMMEAVERLFRGFGATQIPYFSISKVNSRLLKSYFAIKDIFGKK